MSSSLAGIGFLLLFAISQGARDAFFGNTFQSVSFLLVAALAFGASTVCFSGVALLRCSGEIAKALASPGPFLALNVMTALAWLSFFFSLSHLEPAVVATLYNGIGPLTVLALQSVHLTSTKSKPTLVETACYVGVGATLLALAVVVLTNRSGLSAASSSMQAVALVAAVLGGAMITISHMIARWFNDAGVSSDSVMGTRFLLTLLIAAGAEALLGDPAARPAAAGIALLTVTAFLLITVPSFMLQLGIARASPLAVNVFRSLGPVFVFLVQQLDGRLQFSGATLLCVVGFCCFTIGASLLRGWSEARDAGA